MIADRTFLAPLLAASLLLGVAGFPSLSGAEEDPLVPVPGAGETAAGEAETGPPPSEAKLHGLLGALASDEYRTRMEAQAELLALASRHALPVSEALVGPYLTATDPDLRARLRLTLWNAKRHEMNSRPTGFVGIQMADSFRQLGQQANGMLPTVQIMRVIEGTAAARNDLRVGDQIVGIDGKEFGNGVSPSIVFKEEISARAVGDTVELKILRGPQELKVKVELGERPMELLGLADDERERMEASFNAFLRASAKARGLPAPGGDASLESLESGSDVEEVPAVIDPGDPFGQP